MPIIKSVSVDKFPGPEIIHIMPNANITQLAVFKTFLTFIIMHVLLWFTFIRPFMYGGMFVTLITLISEKLDRICLYPSA